VSTSLSDARQRRAALGRFLRARREELTPADVGLPSVGGRRRALGLRRVEVCELAGISVTWYTWLEQGREINPSTQVLAAIAGALRLDANGRRYAFELSGLRDPTPHADGAQPLATAPLESALQRMLDALDPCPAYLMTECLDILAWNRAETRVWRELAELPPVERNLLWQLLADPALRRLLRHWEERTRPLVRQLRMWADTHPRDRRARQLIDALRTRSDDFVRWWEQGEVDDFHGAVNVLEHPRVGQVSLDLVQLRPVERPDLRLVLHTPRAPADRRKLEQLQELP
jgi:transcriptional regulator with XRE-family HTH domain